ncbi:unnamed protein product [Arctia plantaginis]|uniref:Uncharacterized protein n=1 Tax=Arctia plantaginis TaxID=874455 RepID=A0A8S0Z4Q7_ARCPL|nr:unnamed protein product [Arctia plantaginis]CAB3237472.1 unnamed protein product [Arctia plantaginis]
MLRFLVPFLLTFAAVTAHQDSATYFHDAYPSAASTSQIKFAEENNYDDTGPAAKKPVYAYNTYKTLEEALVAYLDDPDTKLPEHEREKAVQKLLKSTAYPKPDIFEHYPKTFHSAAFKQSQQEYHSPVFSQLDSKTYYGTDSQTGFNRGYYNTKPEPFKFQKFQTVKGSPLSLSHYNRKPELRSSFGDFNSYPKYSFSYGVHDKSTGDLKHAAEDREGETVRGFYSFIDATGKPHTVQYSDNGKGLL